MRVKSFKELVLTNRIVKIKRKELLVEFIKIILKCSIRLVELNNLLRLILRSISLVLRQVISR